VKKRALNQTTIQLLTKMLEIVLTTEILAPQKNRGP